MVDLGYARVSTGEQNHDLQVRALTDAGCARIFEDTASGSTTTRPKLDKMLEYARAGDVIVVWKLDRLGRSLRHLIDVISGLEERGVGFRSLTDGIDTSTPAGRLCFHVFGALAEFERDLIRERTRAGLDAARDRGSQLGRKPALTAEQKAHARRMVAAGTTVSEAARILNCPRQSVYRALDEVVAAAT
ncbi:recombinase family protein [Pseudofrankia sp. BMG5.37]|uniref:recombinase family protein n=1 Tax=Pseudofrankia sp. BMG5.37 TaxID=3050035 RepID=UPI002893BA3F|nr:recombinase family protein [Pseudofrankia sp. BMG5.37]MDT3438349.1 recombinase family protein [Pseudofrankia sp. BMG5.37]